MGAVKACSAEDGRNPEPPKIPGFLMTPGKYQPAMVAHGFKVQDFVHPHYCLSLSLKENKNGIKVERCPLGICITAVVHPS